MHDGEVPERKKVENIDNEMLSLLESYPAKIADLIEKYKIKDAVFEMMSLARAGNKYFNDSEPWISVKKDLDKCATSINVCLNAIYTLAEVFEPVIPFASKKIFHMLNAKETSWFDSGKENLKPGHKLNKAEILFTKIEDKVIEEQINKLGKVEGEEEPKVKEISIDEFKNVKLRVAKILFAENVKKSDKLLRLELDLGGEKRQVVAGIAKSYSPDQLVGMQVLVVANLKPAKLFGLESQGMILAVDSSEEGKVKIIEIDSSVKPGTEAK